MLFGTRIWNASHGLVLFGLDKSTDNLVTGFVLYILNRWVGRGMYKVSVNEFRLINSESSDYYFFVIKLFV